MTTVGVKGLTSADHIIHTLFKPGAGVNGWRLVFFHCETAGERQLWQQSLWTLGQRFWFVSFLHVTTKQMFHRH